MKEHSHNLSYEDRIARVRERFVSTLADRLEDILQAIETTTESTSGETHARKVHRLLHDAGGNAAMLEFDGIEMLLRQGVLIAERVDANGTSLTEADKAELKKIIAETHYAAASLRKTYQTL
ncbi:hypothetical protein [Yoonia sp. MH D7]